MLWNLFYDDALRIKLRKVAFSENLSIRVEANDVEKLNFNENESLDQKKKTEAVVLKGLKRRTEVRIMTSEIRYSKQVSY